MRHSSRSASRTRPLGLLPTLLIAGAAGLAACGSSSGSGSDFSVRTTSQAADPAQPLVVSGDLLVYMAAENFNNAMMMGTDLNGDGDMIDRVASFVNMASRIETNLGVASLAAVIVGREVYLVVDEALDGVDWNGGGLTDIVLVHWSEATAMPVLVDTLDFGFAGELPVNAAGRLCYAARVGALGVDETNLRFLDQDDPTTPVTVMNETGAGAVEAHVVGARQGLVLCVIDETDDGMDRNNDADATDEAVLALLDATDALGGNLKSVELALADEDEPIAVRSTGANDWQVAFLVDETAQGATNLNDQALFTQPLLPDSCAATPDTDTLDRVLHYVDFADFLAGMSMPVNTGLAGRDRVLALSGFVATVSDEADANCNLNAATGDTDMSDDVLRWVATTMPVAPARDAADMHALATGIPGGSFGVSVLDNRFVAVVSESDDDFNHDGKAADHDLVAWIDPVVANPTWVFSHQNPANPGFGTGVFDSDGDSEPFAGTSWMAAESFGGRLPLVFLEAVPGTNPNVGSLNTNLNCGLVAKDSDKVDGLPVWADFEAGPTLDFDGMGYAIDKNNPGIEVNADFAFFRVSEPDDARDYNNDGDMADNVLFRNPLRTCGPIAMATSSLIDSQSITTDRATAGAFLSSETLAGQDFNMDGDMTDLVPRYFRF